MKILGIDYGRRKIGLALSEGRLVEPWKVVTPEVLKKILEEEDFDKIVVGVSSGAMAEEQKKFAQSIGAATFDETLTTKEAQKLSLEAGMPRAKRHRLEDAFAAAIMLQNYLES